jgi:hypothetical protein
MFCAEVLDKHFEGKQAGQNAGESLATKVAQQEEFSTKSLKWKGNEAECEMSAEHGKVGKPDSYVVSEDGHGQYKWQAFSGGAIGSTPIDSGSGYDSLERAKAECERDYARKSVGAGMSAESPTKEGVIPEAVEQPNEGMSQAGKPPKMAAKVATNEGGVPPTGEATFGDTVIATGKAWPPTQVGTMMKVIDAAVVGDRNECLVEFDKALLECCSDLQMKHHLQTFIQIMGTALEKKWGIVSDIEVSQVDRDACTALCTFRCSFRSPFPLAERVS